MLGNLQGYHVLILLAVVVVAITVVLVVVATVRRRSAGHGDPASRIEQLTRLHDQGSVSDEEFETKRHQIWRRV